MDQTQKLIITLSAILIAVLAASGIIFFLLPSATPSTPSTTSDDAFTTPVFQKPGFTQLDQRAVLDNSLPVPPPASAGKANPFL